MIGIELLGGFRITRDGLPLTVPFSGCLQSLVAYLTLHACARAIVNRFAERAFRRSVERKEVDRYLGGGRFDSRGC